jgi:heme/copper-type cytochrome/quinol oxidase subunit 2
LPLGSHSPVYGDAAQIELHITAVCTQDVIGVPARLSSTYMMIAHTIQANEMYCLFVIIIILCSFIFTFVHGRLLYSFTRYAAGGGWPIAR